MPARGMTDIPKSDKTRFKNQLQDGRLMKVTDRLHAFVWTSMTNNNCNTYLIDGSVKILIDPGAPDAF